MALVLRCNHCAAEHRQTPEAMLSRLRSLGMLRREAKPSDALVQELFTSLADQLTCESCGSLGVTMADDWQDDWADERTCAGCHSAIDPDRLEIFPKTKLCTKCQQKQDAGEDIHQQVDYCVRCGGVLELKSRTRGTSGYHLVCAACGKR